MVETLGSETLIYLSWINDESNEFIMRLQGRCSYRNGDRIYIKFDKEKIHLFNKETEKTVLNLDNL